ncbi:Uncharacterised protein [Salmonella enterica subsp. enterica serovar Bovismorbificans]|uniref:Uncharacterized protein n=1 Tax=Salmonella enterica subsp. enterica serovar Bovismorbificans TaxID=58097 RepID=A0A655E5D0_SALET|nr:Uncharacterised protein [Salmonella enterica subsp. enterica serovar Bovismorbificans]CNT58701.1 Uncharacterised protein [Salmonella enterica subsp. enterica serovar Bovismorbificans]CNT58808.1 Uncharacterised protein [Salmonella enterica subsp. enterica serovar Bovismorbificans]CNT79952.1 Uncharacterised protein [Salmonella enterica subsp. enterica serovar Bovismorbificans]CNU13108.1 Uncharacterised protein [Salmonella enterica subsp. enterica serovar Bovismorbificans]
MFTSNFILRAACRTLNFSQLSLKIVFEIFQLSQFSVEGFHFPGKFSFFLLDCVDAFVVFFLKIVKFRLQLLRDMLHIFNVSHYFSPG